jgi:hypothetical protein
LCRPYPRSIQSVPLSGCLFIAIATISEWFTLLALRRHRFLGLRLRLRRTGLRQGLRAAVFCSTIHLPLFALNLLLRLALAFLLLRALARLLLCTLLLFACVLLVPQGTLLLNPLLLLTLAFFLLRALARLLLLA